MTEYGYASEKVKYRVLGAKKSVTSIQSKYFIYIFNYIVGPKNYFQFRSSYTPA